MIKILNRIVLVGRIVADLELRYTNSGTPVCNFRIAVERNYTNKNGDRDVDYINIVTWRGLAENCAKHLEKGRLVGVDGSLQIRKSQKDNRTYINPEVNADNVRFLDFGNNNQGGGGQQSKNSKQTNNSDDQFDDNFDADDFDDNIPF